VLLTDLLDTFGQLVIDRISTLLNSAAFTQAKETWSNWFLKISCIHELLPRVYLEISVLKGHFIIQPSGIHNILDRMIKSIRGIGDPLVAEYCRAYLAHKGSQVVPKYKEYLVQGWNDHLFVLQQQSLSGEKLDENLNELHITKEDYIKLFNPATSWQQQCIESANVLSNTV